MCGWQGFLKQGIASAVNLATSDASQNNVSAKEFSFLMLPKNGRFYPSPQSS